MSREGISAVPVKCLRVDLHAHTHASPDCRLSPEKLVRVLRERGINVVAITDHNTMDGAFEFAELATFPVIMGEEIKTSEGDVIGLFLRRPIERDMSPVETVCAIKEQGGVAMVPHPFDRLRRSALGRAAVETIMDDIDILEVFNGRTIRAADNDQADLFAVDHGLARSVGSDSHLAIEVGRSWQSMRPWTHPTGFLESLRHAELCGRLSPKWVHLGSSLHAYTIKAEKRIRRVVSG